jgi:hypothetical protein
MIPENAISKAVSDPSAVAEYLFTRAQLTISRVLTSIEGKLTRTSAFNLYDHDWDVAIVLDALRYDTAVSSQLPNILDDPVRVYSTGAHSEPWIRRTFNRATKSQRESTAYVTANIHAGPTGPDDIGFYDPVWKNGFDPELGTFPPRIITNRAITTARNQDFDRLLIHYMQPHLPPTFDTDVELGLDRGGNGWEAGNPWKRVEKGELDGEMVMKAYRQNASELAEELDLLLSNIDGDRVLVTADHGNMLGECGQWGHYRKWNPHPAVRQVPLFKTTATDTKEHTPDWLTIEDDTRINKKLEALGYR